MRPKRNFGSHRVRYNLRSYGTGIRHKRSTVILVYSLRALPRRLLHTMVRTRHGLVRYPIQVHFIQSSPRIVINKSATVGLSRSERVSAHSSVRPSVCSLVCCFVRPFVTNSIFLNFPVVDHSVRLVAQPLLQPQTSFTEGKQFEFRVGQF